MAKVKTIEIVDIENVREEKLRYQKNSLAYMLGFIGILLSAASALICLNTMKPNFLTIVKILMNVVLLLFGFLSCEKVKNYSKKFSLVMFVFGAASVLRIFWMPLQMIVQWSNANTKTTDKDSMTTYLKKYFSEQVYNGDLASKKGFLPRNAAFRGVLCMILLIGSALAYFFSGYVGYLKANKLEKHLKSINVDFNKR